MSRASKPVVLITGVSGGIGQAAAQRFAAHGWIVVGTVRGRNRGASLSGLQIDLQVADMLKPRDLERVVKTTWLTYGRIDALVCNAGYGLIAPLEDLDYAQMNEQFLVNTIAPAELIRSAAALMRGQKSGTIVGVSSVVGRTGLPGYSIYSASKYALEGLFESLAMELAPSRIRVKLVEPSAVNTPFWTAVQGGRRRPASGVSRGKSNDYVSRRGGELSAEAVARSIYRAATDGNGRLRYPLGNTRFISVARRLLPDRLYMRLIRRVITGH